jgi:hypothetical protein
MIDRRKAFLLLYSSTVGVFILGANLFSRPIEFDMKKPKGALAITGAVERENCSYIQYLHSLILDGADISAVNLRCPLCGHTVSWTSDLLAGERPKRVQTVSPRMEQGKDQWPEVG